MDFFEVILNAKRKANAFLFEINTNKIYLSD